MSKDLAQYLRLKADEVEKGATGFDGCVIHLTRSHDLAVQSDSFNPTMNGDVVPDMLAAIKSIEDAEFKKQVA